jgi:PKHD-type hydroxylase
MDCNWLVFVIITMKYDYFFWQNLFSKEELKELNNICSLKKLKQFQDSPAYSNVHGKLKNLDSVSCVEWKDVKGILQKALDVLQLTNQSNYGYSLYDFNDLDSVLFNTYKENDFYHWHKDGSGNSFHDVKFTIIINNSLQNYQDGGIQIFSHGGETTITEFEKPGTLLMFESDIPHRVLPIAKGIRNSIVFFMKGPKFI